MEQPKKMKKKNKTGIVQVRMCKTEISSHPFDLIMLVGKVINFYKFIF